jgi:endoribonuclease LACTB2
VSAITEADAAPHQPFEAQPGVHVVPLRTPTLPPATHTNCVVVGDSERVIVIDPASPFTDEQDRFIGWLKARQVAVDAVWLTHHHADHVLAAQAVKDAFDAPILAHPATIERLGGIVSVDEGLFDGDVAEFEGLSIEALHTPGHARGHLAFRDPQTRLVVAGDLVAGQGTIVIDPPEGDMGDYLVTLARLIQDGIGAVVPAHGPLIVDGEAKLFEYIAHRQHREEQVADAIRARGEGKAIDLVPAVYPDVPAMFWPLAARQLLAHLLKMEVEGLVDRPDGSTGAPGSPVYMAAGAFAAPDSAFRWTGS